MLVVKGMRAKAGGFTIAADLSVESARFCAVIGPSGAGKSTFLNAIAGFTELAAGEIAWSGVRIDSLPPGDRPLSMLFQDGNLFPHLTLAQNVGLGIRPGLRLTATETSRVGAALAQVGLADLGQRRPATVSGGQQSRAAVARVLVQRRKLILLDEPFSALGPALKDEMLDLMANLARDMGATVLMVTHDPGDARRVATETIVVADGQAQPPVTTQDLLDNPPKALQDYLSQSR